MASLFQGIEHFVAIAEQGSFRSAARELGISPGAVSRALARLEEELGVRLFHRTTRRLRITEEGELYLTSCRAALQSVRSAREAVSSAGDSVAGAVVISVSPILASRIARKLVPVIDKYPELEVELRCTDRFVDLVEDNVDIAIRIGLTQQMTHRVRRLGRTRWVTVASPAYLKKYGRPSHPDELHGHRGINFISPNGGEFAWTFRSEANGEQIRQLTPPARLRANLGAPTLEAVRLGAGICQTFDFLVEADLASGELEEILTDYSAEGPSIWAVTLPGHPALTRVRTLIDAVAEGREAGGRGEQRSMGELAEESL